TFLSEPNETASAETAAAAWHRATAKDPQGAATRMFRGLAVCYPAPAVRSRLRFPQFDPTFESSRPHNPFFVCHMNKQRPPACRSVESSGKVPCPSRLPKGPAPSFPDRPEF